MTTQADIKLVIDQLNNLEVVHDYDENVTDGAAQMLETLGNQVAKQAARIIELEGMESVSLVVTQMKKIASQAAVIEKLRSVLKLLSFSDNKAVSEIAYKALAIPTDSDIAGVA